MKEKKKQKSGRTKKSKGQIFTIDYAIALIIFIFLILLSIKVIIGIQPKYEYDTLIRENTYISEQLVKEGYPSDWNTTNVIIPGITDNTRLNETKLSQLDNITYERLKTLMHTTSDFAFFFTNGTQNLNISNCIHGHPVETSSTCEINISSIEYSDLVKTERLLIHNSSIIKLVVYNWN